jgi:hypothetical protein
MMFWLKVLLCSSLSALAVLLLEQYILLETVEPVRCDAGGEPPAPPEEDVIPLDRGALLESYPIPKWAEDWIKSKGLR